MVVSRFVDGILLVARAGTTTRDQAQAAKTACEKAGAQVFGTVLNATAVTEGDQPSYYAYYGSAEVVPEAGRDVGVSLMRVDGRDRLPSENGRAGRHRRVRSGSR
jgi:Mrp family chromosome partitioning ATPase